MITACSVKAARGSPVTARRVVQFRGRKGLGSVVISSCDKDHAVWEQGRRVKIACSAKAASGAPGMARRVVELGGRGKSRCNKDLTVWQQGRRVSSAWGVKVAGETPDDPARCIF